MSEKDSFSPEPPTAPDRPTIPDRPVDRSAKYRNETEDFLARNLVSSKPPGAGVGELVFEVAVIVLVAATVVWALCFR